MTLFTTFITTDYKIAAGYNEAGTLAAITGIIPTDDQVFLEPLGFGFYSAGEFRPRADGLRYLAGFGSTKWIFSALTPAQYAYLRTTYCNGGYSGKVTIRTPTGTTTWANFNAVMQLPMPNEMQWSSGVWENVTVQFNRMVAL